MSGLPTLPPPPLPVPPRDSLEGRVQRILQALPIHCRSAAHVEDLAVPELPGLGPALGPAVAQRVVTTLNMMRLTWDPDGELAGYTFRRQSRIFPDVLLVADANDRDIQFGISLQPWFLLASARGPDFRFRATATACGEQDVICIVPWHLSHAVSGAPVVAKPILVRARHAAAHRNWWWADRQRAQGGTDVAIEIPEGVAPYPDRQDRIEDRPGGGGDDAFGCLTGIGLIDDAVARRLDLPLLGIAAGEWLRFLVRAQMSEWA